MQKPLSHLVKYDLTCSVFFIKANNVHQKLAMTLQICTKQDKMIKVYLNIYISVHSKTNKNNCHFNQSTIYKIITEHRHENTFVLYSVTQREGDPKKKKKREEDPESVN